MTLLFEPLVETNCDEIDITLFWDCAEASEGRQFAQYMWDELCKGELTGWKWIGDKGRGLLLTKIQDSYTRRELFMFAVAGKGYLYYMPEIFENLREYGRQYGCTVLAGDAKRKGLQKAYEKFGAKESFRQYEISLTHG